MTTPTHAALLYIDQDMTEPQHHAMTSGAAAVYSARSPAKDTPNEDAAALIPYAGQSAVLLVADGMGGGPAGEHASRITIEAIQSSMARGADGQLPLRSALLNGIEDANSQVQALGGAATTLAAIEVQPPHIRPYHAGDSMTLVVGLRGKRKLATISHSPVGFAVEAGVLDETDAMHHEDRHLVSNVIGTPDTRIEVGSMLTLAPMDTLLVASDGLFDNLHTREIVEHIRKGPLKTAARGLMDDALQRMIQPLEGQPSKPDDLTFILFRLRWGKE